MDTRGNLFPGEEGKSGLLKSVLENTKCAKMKKPNHVDCFAVDAMYLFNQIIPKPSWVTSGADVAKEFCKRIDDKSQSASFVIVAFDTYRERSLKDKTRTKRQEQKKHKTLPRYYDVQDDTNIKKMSMMQLFAHKMTKTSLSKLLFLSVVQHFKSRNVHFIVAYDGKTTCYFDHTITTAMNNHQEADSLLINCLVMAPLANLTTYVYSVDTDVFALLLKHNKQY